MIAARLALSDAGQTQPPTFGQLGANERLAMLYVAWPAGIGVIMGINHVGYAQNLTPSVSLVFWTAQSILLWLGLHAGSAIVSMAWPGCRKSLLPILLIGGFIASLALRPAVYLYAQAFEPFSVSGAAARPTPQFHFTIVWLVEHLRVWSAVLSTWVLSNLFWRHALGFQPYAGPVRQALDPAPTLIEQIAGEPSLSLPAQAFLSRILPIRREDIIVLESEDHFVRAHLRDRSILVYGSLGSAIEAMAAVEGVRIHRRYWVTRNAVATVQSTGRRLDIRLHSGLTIPVSRTYRELLRQLGLPRSDGSDDGVRSEHER